MSQAKNIQALQTQTEYLPGRECLLVQIDLSQYLIDYYLHQSSLNKNITAEQDEKLKQLIAGFAVHLALHAAGQTHAWTLHTVEEPPCSLFVTGALSAQAELREASGYLVGNVLTENIRHTDVNSLHTQFVAHSGEPSRSYVQCESPEILDLVSHYYTQSEQQRLRLKPLPNSDRFIALAALPDFDESWFEQVELLEIPGDIACEKKLLRTCQFVFKCDCSPEKLLPFFKSLPKQSLSELYGEDQALIINCPRCGADFPISRSEFLDN